MQKYWSPLVDRLNPYVPGEQPQDQQYIKLNTNENPYPPSPKVLHAMKEGLTEVLRLYPDPEAVQLKKALADNFNLLPNQVFVGNGSDEVLAFAFMAFFSEKHFIQYPEISYSFYPVYCDLFNIEARPVPLDADFSINFDRFSKEASGIIFPNPNAPTGKLMTLEPIKALLERNRQSVVIVDEAYIDFGGESSVDLVEQYQNLLVIQTFSKSRSLAGMRIGYAMGDIVLIDALTRVKNSFNSYPLDRMAQIAAQAAIEDEVYFESSCQKIIVTREDVSNKLRQMGFTVIPSASNFVLVKHREFSGEQLLNALKERGILVRNFKTPIIANYLRISVGSDAEMDMLIDRLDEIISST